MGRLLDEARFTSDVKRLNQRAVQVGKTFGTNSPLYKEYQAAMSVYIPDEFLNKRADGGFSISRSTKFFEAGGHEEVKKLLEKLPSAQEERAKSRKQLKGEDPNFKKLPKSTQEKMITEHAQERMQVYSEVDEAIKALYGREDQVAAAALSVARIRNRKKDFNELKFIVQVANGEVTDFKGVVDPEEIPFLEDDDTISTKAKNMFEGM